MLLTPATSVIVLQDYPQLTLISWGRPGSATVCEEDALALYERSWAHVDEDALLPHERALIDRLISKHGKGSFLV